MKTRTACSEQNLIWVIDDEINGLYSIDKRSLETKCVIGCQELFPCGTFEISSLLKWKDYIILIPREMDKSWILYNKATGKTEYRNVIERKCQGILISVDMDRGQLYFLPLSVQDPVLIVELDTLICLQMIENWSNGLPKTCDETAWRGVYTGQYILFPVKSTKFVVRMDCETRNVDLLKLDIPKNVLDLDYAYGELWMLPEVGNQIYQIDEKGFVIDTAEVSLEDTKNFRPDFVRIVVQKNYLFLMPAYRKGIYIYDKREGKTRIIPEETPVSGGNDKKFYLRYWEYYAEEERICFLPFEDQYIEICLDNLAYKTENIAYPDEWSEEEKAWRTVQGYIAKRLPIIKDAEGCDLKDFLSCVQYKAATKDFLQSRLTGRTVWNFLKIQDNRTW